MASLKFAVATGALGALVLLVYAMFQFGDPAADMENLLRGFLGLGLGLIALAVTGLAVGLRDVVE